jgi:hypothetical protein
VNELRRWRAERIEQVSAIVAAVVEGRRRLTWDHDTEVAQLIGEVRELAAVVDELVAADCRRVRTQGRGGETKLTVSVVGWYRLENRREPSGDDPGAN